jgi:hypothetical protein
MEMAMPDLLIRDMDAALYRRLDQLAKEQEKPLAHLARELLALAEGARHYLEAIPDQTVRDIRRCRDGGCGFCDELEVLVRLKKVKAEAQPQ